MKIYALATNFQNHINVYILERQDETLVWSSQRTFLDHSNDSMYKKILREGRSIATSIQGNNVRSRDRQTTLLIVKAVSEKLNIPYVGDLENEIELYKEEHLNECRYDLKG